MYESTCTMCNQDIDPEVKDNFKKFEMEKTVNMGELARRGLKNTFRMLHMARRSPIYTNTGGYPILTSRNLLNLTLRWSNLSKIP